MTNPQNPTDVSKAPSALKEAELALGVYRDGGLFDSSPIGPDAGFTHKVLSAAGGYDTGMQKVAEDPVAIVNGNHAREKRKEVIESTYKRLNDLAAEERASHTKKIEDLEGQLRAVKMGPRDTEIRTRLEKFDEVQMIQVLPQLSEEEFNAVATAPARFTQNPQTKAIRKQPWVPQDMLDREFARRRPQIADALETTKARAAARANFAKHVAMNIAGRARMLGLEPVDAQYRRSR